MSNSDNLRPATSTGQIAAGGALLLTGTLIGQLLLLAATVLLARKLGPDRYGLYALATTTVLTIMPIAGLALPTTVVRFIAVATGADKPEDISGAMASALVVALIASVAFSVVLALAAPLLSTHLLHEPRLTSLLRWIALALPALVFMDVIVATARALNLMLHAAIAPMLRSLSLLILVIVVTLEGHLTALSAVNIYTISALVALVVVAVAGARRAAGVIKPPWHWQIRGITRYSLPLTFSTLLYTLWLRVDRYVVAGLFGTAETGRYALVATAAIYLSFMHSALVTAFLPGLADRYHGNDFEGAGFLFNEVTKLDCVLTFPIALTATLVWKDALHLIGGSYEAALPAAVLLSIGVYLNVLTGPTEGLLMVTDHQGIEMLNAVVALGTGIGADIGLGKLFGLGGVAAGAAVAATTLNILHLVEIRRFYGFHPFNADHIKFTAVTSLVLIGSAFMGVYGGAALRWLLLLVCLGIYARIAWTSYRQQLLRMIRERRAIPTDPDTQSAG